jgi:hypothetical protein
VSDKSGTEKASRVTAFLNVELFRVMYGQNKGNPLPPLPAIERQIGGAASSRNKKSQRGRPSTSLQSMPGLSILRRVDLSSRESARHRSRKTSRQKKKKIPAMEMGRTIRPAFIRLSKGYSRNCQRLAMYGRSAETLARYGGEYLQADLQRSAVKADILK